MSPRDQSQAQPRDQRPERDGDGEKPLLQGHLKKKRSSSQAPVEQPAVARAETPVSEAKGKRTRSRAETATLPHLEGSEQGPS